MKLTTEQLEKIRNRAAHQTSRTTMVTSIDDTPDGRMITLTVSLPDFQLMNNARKDIPALLGHINVFAQAVKELREILIKIKPYMEHCLTPTAPNHTCGPESLCDADCVNYFYDSQNVRIVDKAISDTVWLEEGLL